MISSSFPPRAVLALAASAFLASCATPAASDPSPSAALRPVFAESPCPEALQRAGARCGVVHVPENRADPAGRRIALRTVVLGATGAGATLPPLFDLDGGPGLPATKNVAFYATAGGAYRERRDIVLVDQRGTGESNGLHCPALAVPSGAEMLPVAGVIACRDSLVARADLRRYGTTEAAADLDAVREALGYGQIDIFALSYGTTLALRYMAEYPDRLRAAVLMGTAPADLMPPRRHASAGERALRLLFADCAADPACGAGHPPLDADLDRALSRLDGQSGPSPELFMEKLRTLMYSPAAARRIPFIVRRAAAGDLAPFRALPGANAASMIADGMFLSVTCTESFGAMDYEPAAAAARRTRFGDYRLRRQREACRHWPRGPVSRSLLAPVSVRSPVLLVSGRLDPVTPPEYAEAVARRLPNSRHLVIPHGGHILDGLSGVETCFDPLVLRFLERGSLEDLDAACVAEMRPPPFQVSGEE